MTSACSISSSARRVSSPGSPGPAPTRYTVPWPPRERYPGRPTLRLREQLGGAGRDQPLGDRPSSAPGSPASPPNTSRIQGPPSGRPT